MRLSHVKGSTYLSVHVYFHDSGSSLEDELYCTLPKNPLKEKLRANKLTPMTQPTPWFRLGIEQDSYISIEPKDSGSALLSSRGPPGRYTFFGSNVQPLPSHRPSVGCYSIFRYHLSTTKLFQLFLDGSTPDRRERVASYNREKWVDYCFEREAKR